MPGHPPQFQKAAKRKLKKGKVEGSKAEEAGESKKEAAAEGDAVILSWLC